MNMTSPLAARMAACALICAHDFSQVVKLAAVITAWLHISIVLESGMDALCVCPDGAVLFNHCGETAWVPVEDSYYEPPKGPWHVSRLSEADVYGLAGVDPPVHLEPRNDTTMTGAGCYGPMPSSILRR